MSPHRPPSGNPRGFYGVAVWHPKTSANVGSLWRTAQTYDAAFLATIGARYRHQASDTMKSTANVPLHHYRDMPDLIEHLPHGCRVVGIELDDSAVPLDEYEHPRTALYLLGAEDHGLAPEVLAQCHEVVAIPSPQPRSINVAVAGSLIVMDRYMQHRAKVRDLEAAS